MRAVRKDRLRVAPARGIFVTAHAEDERILTDTADGRDPCESRRRKAIGYAARLRVGDTTVRGDGFNHLSDLEKPVLAARQERRRAVMADLSAFEPPAERLRYITPKSYRVDGCTLPFTGGSASFTTESPESIDTNQ